MEQFNMTDTTIETFPSPQIQTLQTNGSVI